MMRDGAAAKDGPLAPSLANSASRRCVEALSPPKAFSWRRYAIARVRNDRLISRDGAFPNVAFQRSRSSSISSFDRLAISDARGSRSRTCARRFMIVSLETSRLSTRLPSSYVLLLEARDLLSQSHTHCSFRGTEPVVRGGRFRAMSALIRSRLLCCDSLSPSNRPDRADRRSAPIAGFLPFCANDVEKIGGNHSLHAPTRANIPTSPKA